MTNELPLSFGIDYFQIVINKTSLMHITKLINTKFMILSEHTNKN
jgi:hypothetical protein